MLKNILPAVAIVASLLSPIWALPGSSQAGSPKPIRDQRMHLNFGLELREICVGAFPRFEKAASVLESKPYFEKRPGQNIWHHSSLAVAIALTRIEGKSACVMHVVAKRWKEGTWASYAVPVFWSDVGK